MLEQMYLAPVWGFFLLSDYCQQSRFMGDYFYVNFGYEHKDFDSFSHHGLMVWGEVSGYPTGKVDLYTAGML